MGDWGNWSSAVSCKKSVRCVVVVRDNDDEGFCVHGV